MLTLHAKQVSHTNAKVITKINRINFTDVINQLDLGSVLYPKYITSEAIIAYVRARQAASEESNIETISHLFNQRVEAIEFHITEQSSITNVPLKDLRLKKNLLIAFIARKGSILIPSGNDTLQKDDNVMVVTTHVGFRDIHDIVLD